MASWHTQDYWNFVKAHPVLFASIVAYLSGLFTGHFVWH